MTSGAVTVDELQADLPRYLQDVRQGGEIQVIDRGAQVARIVPPEASDEELLSRLVASGVLRAGRGDPLAVLDEPPLQIPCSLVEALTEEREDRV